MIKKQFILEGLDCAACSMKIEEKVSKINYVENVTLNFVNKTLSLNVDEDKEDKIEDEIKYIVNRLEPDVKVRTKSNYNKNKAIIKKPQKAIKTRNNERDKITLLLEGLDCANCANKIEHHATELIEVKEASLDFISKKLRIDLNNKEDYNKTIKNVENIVKKLEPDVKVVNITMNGKATVKKSEINRSTNKDNTEEENLELIKFVVGTAFFVAAVILNKIEWIKILFFIISYVLVGGDVVLNAIKNIFKGQVFDENFLMTIATVGAFSIKQYPEAVAVMIFYKIGELFQSRAVNHSRKSISDLMDIRPDYAVLLKNNKEIKVSPYEIQPNDIIIVKPGEKIPLDGVIIEGNSQVDTSALTGESLPKIIRENDEVLGGYINKNGVIRIKVTKEFGESTISKILDLVENASSKKAETEKFITKFARYYTPIVVISALLLAIVPPLVIPGATFDSWIYRALVFLVVSCPCALVVSIPLGFFGGIGAASKQGILIKGGNYLEALNKVDSVVFDKTGTLTKGVFKVTKIKPEDWIKESELIRIAAHIESYSNHPIALSIASYYEKNIEKDKVTSINEYAGMGLEGIFDGKFILAGNDKLMDKQSINYSPVEEPGTVIYMTVNNIYAGYILISDELKEDSKEAIKGLRSLGIKNTVMLTGDSIAVAGIISEQLGLNKFYAGLLPQDKVEKLEEIFSEKSKNGKVVFVGDGINDAPVLARADIGIAMGGVGSDAAIEAADIVIMNDEPSKITKAIDIAKKTNKIVWQNIIFALTVKFIILALGALGYATMWEAVFGDVGVALIAVLNSMRVLKTK
ncbi:heavy metal translocating P-type ATPase [Clostridium frigidicarnis]|uniref:Cd2+/Zn2+-exporting ATPase n=1 Tax=Clostridium frigidicarnis TaxID=84698 RepID=A0A1I0ZHP8_9CLOT|nr:Cd2+/Zn2+-exporting ATPase [Clostridium frigidicarnis]